MPLSWHQRWTRRALPEFRWGTAFPLQTAIWVAGHLCGRWGPGGRWAQGPGRGLERLTQQPVVQGHHSISVLSFLKRGPSTWYITYGSHVGIVQKYTFAIRKIKIFKQPSTITIRWHSLHEGNKAVVDEAESAFQRPTGMAPGMLFWALSARLSIS